MPDARLYMELLLGETTDIDSWMKLVKQVSWNFPGLETTENIDEHRDTVLKFMDKKQALWCSSFFTQKEYDLLSGCSSCV